MSTPPPPPPPEFPPMGNGDDPFGNGDSGDQGPGLSQGAPTVAANPGRMVLVLGVLAIVVIFLLYNIFSGGSKDKQEEQPNRSVAPQIEPPPIQEPTPVAPPPTFQPPSVPAPTTVDLIRPADDSAAQEQRLARMRSKMVVSDGGSGGSLFGGGSATAPTSEGVGTDPNSQFAAQVAAANTQAPRVEATRIGDLRRTIAQGRLIQATMESALNTELPAPIRAIVSRDTYGEAGTEPLIPKGSRLIGSYNTQVASGQSRVFVVWTRVIRPDGVDVMINSPLVDQIGQAGIGGQVDTKFQQVFSRSVMASVISIAFAIGSDSVSGGSTTTNSSALGGSSTTGDAATTATVNALNRLGSTTDSFLQKFIGVQPTILVDQGTPVNVFVNRDLVFPADMAGTRVIQ